MAPIDHYGYVEGYVTYNGVPADSVDIYFSNSAAFSSSPLSKRAAIQPVTKDSMGHYKLALTEGTYNIGFQKPLFSRTVRVEKFITVAKGEIETLDVDFNEIIDTIKVTPTGLKTVSITWTTFASYYQVLRSKDSLLWTFVPGTQNITTGRKVYSATYGSVYDTVPDYGTYYYRVLGFSPADSFISEAIMKKYTVENTPPIVKSVFFGDSIRYLYCSLQLNTGYPDYSKYKIVILHSNLPSQLFTAYDTVGSLRPFETINANQFVFRDSVCDTGLQAFRFYTLDVATGQHSDTSNAYAFQYKKMAPSFMLSAYDYMLYVQLAIQRTGSITTSEAYEIMRSKKDTTKAVAIDTVYFSTNSFIYQDYTAEADTYYYAVKQLCTNGSNCPRSNFTGIAHLNAPAVPTVYSLIDSGTYVRLQYSTSSTTFPVIIFRATAKDTAAIDTIMPMQNTTYIYRDYPPGPGIYSYAVAHLGLHSEVGKKSPWMVFYFENTPVMPGLNISQINGTTVSCRISNINNISGIIIRRTESISGIAQKTDTIYTSEFYDYELSTTNPQSLIYPDILTTAGSYYYTVNTFNINGNLSRDAVAAIFFPAQLPIPSQPTVSTSSHYICITAPSAVSSSNTDSVSIYRAKDSMSSFTLVRTIPVSWSTSLNDSVFIYGSGRYYYKIKIIKNGISSDFSAPVEAYYSGLLDTPEAVRLGADSSTVKITIPEYTSPKDSLILYRSVTGSNDLVMIARLDSMIVTSQIIIDIVPQAGSYTYRTKAFHKNLVSTLSVAKNISVPGNGYQIFTAPSINDTLKTGATSSIKWNSKNISAGYVRLSLYNGNTRIQDITTFTVSNTVDSYSWNIPTSITPGSGYYIKMFEYYSDDLLENSAVFYIAAQ
jgi:hypothetical protein